MPRVTPVRELKAEDAASVGSPVRRSSRIAATAVTSTPTLTTKTPSRRNSTSETPTPARVTRRSSLTQEAKGDTLKIPESSKRTPSPSTLLEEANIKSTPAPRRTRRGSKSSVDDEAEVKPPTERRVTRRSSITLEPVEEAPKPQRRVTRRSSSTDVQLEKINENEEVSKNTAAMETIEETEEQDLNNKDVKEIEENHQIEKKQETKENEKIKENQEINEKTTDNEVEEHVSNKILAKSPVVSVKQLNVDLFESKIKSEAEKDNLNKSDSSDKENVNQNATKPSVDVVEVDQSVASSSFKKRSLFNRLSLKNDETDDNKMMNEIVENNVLPENQTGKSESELTESTTKKDEGKAKEINLDGKTVSANSKTENIPVELKDVNEEATTCGERVKNPAAPTEGAVFNEDDISLSPIRKRKIQEIIKLGEMKVISPLKEPTVNEKSVSPKEGAKNIVDSLLNSINQKAGSLDETSGEDDLMLTIETSNDEDDEKDRQKSQSPAFDTLLSTKKSEEKLEMNKTQLPRENMSLNTSENVAEERLNDTETLIKEKKTEENLELNKTQSPKKNLSLNTSENVTEEKFKDVETSIKVNRIEKTLNKTQSPQKNVSLNTSKNVSEEKSQKAEEEMEKEEDESTTSAESPKKRTPKRKFSHDLSVSPKKLSKSQQEDAVGSIINESQSPKKNVSLNTSENVSEEKSQEAEDEMAKGDESTTSTESQKRKSSHDLSVSPKKLRKSQQDDSFGSFINESELRDIDKYYDAVKESNGKDEKTDEGDGEGIDEEEDVCNVEKDVGSVEKDVGNVEKDTSKVEADVGEKKNDAKDLKETKSATDESFDNEELEDAPNLDKEFERYEKEKRKSDDVYKKIDAIIEKYNKKIANEEKDDDDDDEEDENVERNEFIDDMAEEVEEEEEEEGNPSDLENEIPSNGITLSSNDSSAGEDEEPYDDSFIDDDEEVQLLSDDESLSRPEKPKRSPKSTPRMKGKNYSTNEKYKRIISIADSSSDDDQVINIPDDDGADVENDGRGDGGSIGNSAVEKLEPEKTLVEKPVQQVETISVDDEVFVETAKANRPEADRPRKKSSIVIQENISLQDIEDRELSKRITDVVEWFYSGIKESGETSGNVSINVSLDYGDDKNENKKENDKKDNNNEENGQSDADSPSKKAERDETKETIKPSTISGEEEKRKSKENVTMRPSSSCDPSWNISASEVIPSVSEMPNIPKGKSKKRKRGVGSIKPSVGVVNDSWEVESVNNMKPSLSQKKSKSNPTHPRDFRSQVLQQMGRVKRIDTKTFLRTCKNN